jgi:DNA polymerase III epsilon subunit-like protein/very-short-patch-repair endonuclease
MHNTDWIILDTETTGFAAPIFVVEIGAQRMRGWEPVGEPFRKLINQNQDIPPEASRVHGYTREILERDGESANQVHEALRLYVKDLPVVAYNLDYDLDRVLKPEWDRLGIRHMGHGGFCALRLAQRLLDPVPAGNCKLQTLRQYYRLPERGAHTALGDVDTVADLFAQVLRPIAEQRGIQTWDAVKAYAEDEWYPSRFPFGKHKGKSINDARRNPELRGWLEWLAGSTNASSAAMGRWYDSPFEEAVAERLRDKGWEVVPQVGVSRFRIDLGIVHPDRPGDFLVGVECDGATYHRSATARDRDKVRAAVLEGLGWNLLRVWSTDWFVDQVRETERLHAQLESMLNEKRVQQKSEAPDVNANEVVASPLPKSELPLSASLDEGEVFEAESDDDFSENNAVIQGASVYQTVDFSEILGNIDPGKFYDASYDETLMDLIRRTLATEAPIADDLLVQRIARAHDFKRTGRLIRERILALVDEHFHLRQDPVSGAFVWLHEVDPNNMIQFRIPAEGEVARGIEEIPTEEILSATTQSGVQCSAVQIARVLGNKRLTTCGKERIEQAISLLKIQSEPTFPPP